MQREHVGPAIALLVCATLAAYANSFSVPFVFDDRPSIVENATLRHAALVLSPPAGQGITVEGRPLLNLSLAINHALGGASVAGYHAVNLAIHLAAAMALFGLVRRTLRRIGGAMPGAPPASALALASALLWALHPLQTESVTYVVQRAESLMGLFYLLVLYFFLRGIESAKPVPWFAAAVVACAGGMATKEVMVTAPIVVLLFDRTFVAGSFRESWRRRAPLYLSLAATWLLLVWLVCMAGDRGGTIGARAGVTWWQYGLCQSRAVLHYLGLALWPHPLIFDYGADFVTFWSAAPFLLLDAALLGATAVALARNSPAGFLGAVFFVILAPTSSVVGGTRQMLAEHRVYLSLAAFAIGAVVVAHTILGRRALLPATFLAAALALATLARNASYRTEIALYTDTVAKRPGNAFAHYNLGKALADAGQLDAAIAEDEATLRLRPDMPAAENNLANALSDRGRLAEAIPHYQNAVRLNPDYARAHYNLGIALIRVGRKAEALEEFRAAVRLDPADVEARDNLGSALLEQSRWREAEIEFREVVRRNPRLFETHCNLGTVLLLDSRFEEAITEFQRALELHPGFAVARERLELARQRAAAQKRADR